MSELGNMIIMVAMAGGGIFFVLLLIKKKSGGFGFKYKPKPAGEVVSENLTDTVRKNGTKIKKGSLYFGNSSIQNVVNVIEMKGKKPKLSYDEKRHLLIDEGKTTDLDLICFEVANGVMAKIFKFRRDLFILDKSKIEIRNDPVRNNWFLPPNLTWYSYLDIWIADENAKDFARDLAMTFFDETSQTHLINGPNRVVGLEMEHAKRVNIIREKVDAESSKYQPPASASETTVRD